MLIFESIVLFTCLYLALAYAIFCEIPMPALFSEKSMLTDFMTRSFLRSLSTDFPW